MISKLIKSTLYMALLSFTMSVALSNFALCIIHSLLYMSYFFILSCATTIFFTIASISIVLDLVNLMSNEDRKFLLSITAINVATTIIQTIVFTSIFKQMTLMFLCSYFASDDISLKILQSIYICPSFPGFMFNNMMINILYGVIVVLHILSVIAVIITNSISNNRNHIYDSNNDQDYNISINDTRRGTEDYDNENNDVL